MDGRASRARDAASCATASPAGSSDGSYLTPEGQRLTDEVATRRLSAHRAGLDHPAADEDACPAWPASMRSAAIVKQYQVQPDPAKLIALGLSFGDIVEAIEANNVSRGASYIERNGEGYRGRAQRPGREHRRDRRHRRRHARRRARCASGTLPRSRSAARCAPAAPARTATRSSSAPR